MSKKELKLIELRDYFVTEAFGRDGGFEDQWKYYFDKEDLEIEAIPSDTNFGYDEEAYDPRIKLIEENEERFIEIVPLSHFGIHALFHEYLEELKESGKTYIEIVNSCNTKSIGGFFDNVSEFYPDKFWEVRYGWDNFGYDNAFERAKEWFKQRGYELKIK